MAKLRVAVAVAVIAASMALVLLGAGLAGRREAYAGAQPTPAPIVAIYVDTAPMQVPAPAREQLAFTSIAYVDDDILIAASEKADETVGVLYFLQGVAGGHEAHLYRYPGRGPIVLECMGGGERTVMFGWGDGQFGYFDLESGVASFEPYAP